MAMLASAMRRYAHAHRLSVKNRVLRLMVPVNLRDPVQNQGLGNRISLVPVNIPLDINDPEELLRTVHGRMEAVKHAHAADLVVLGGSLLAMLPVAVQAQLAGLLSNVVPVLPFDMVCTNVPGPTRAAVSAGAKNVDLLCLRPDRRLHGRKLRHGQLQRHYVFRFDGRHCLRARSRPAAGFLE